MPLETLLLLIVFAGSFVQSATGVGFGVVAGPYLFQVCGYDRAIVETAVFSLLSALITAALQFRHQETRATIGLSATLPVGVAIGFVTLWVLPRVAVVTLFGIMLCWLGIVLLLRSLWPADPEVAVPDHFEFGREMAGVGILAGAGALLFAAPGPAAAWGLARTHMRPAAIRGTLAVYFVPAYTAILAAFALAGFFVKVDWTSLGAPVPVCVIGTLAGIFLGNRLPIKVLQIAIAAIVVTSGLSILGPLLWRVA